LDNGPLFCLIGDTLLKAIFCRLTYNFLSRRSSVDILTGYGLDGRDSIPNRDKNIFLYSTAFRPALGPTQRPIQSVPVVLTLGVKRRGVKLISHLHLVLTSRMMELYLHSPICLHGVVLRQLYVFCLLQAVATRKRRNVHGSLSLIMKQFLICVIGLQENFGHSSHAV
jgi:hypothetical protein